MGGWIPALERFALAAGMTIRWGRNLSGVFYGDAWKLPWNAACLCGQVRMVISAAPVITMACHCRGCQKLTGGAYSLSLLIPSAGFAVTEGEPVIGGLHGPDRYWFCPHCKCWPYTQPQALPDIVNVRPALLEDASWFTPFAETMAASRLPGAVTGARHSFDAYPPMDQFGPLMAEFARDGARPV